MCTKMTQEEFNTHINKLLPYELEKYVYDLIGKSEKFCNVKSNILIKKSQFDITLVEKSSLDNSLDSQWVIEIKAYKNQITSSLIRAFYEKSTVIPKNGMPLNLLIISTNGFTRHAIGIAKNLGVILWGVNELYKFYINKEISHNHEVNKAKNTSGIAVKCDVFEQALSEIKAGKEQWSKYQSLIIDILEFLLCPPLEAPKVELADKDRRNRRDIIFENSAMKGFWSLIRENYSGHYIVVDAKNYKKALTKRPILDISHYLKQYGCGMFSIIVSRKGYSQSAEHAAKEQWIGSKKMIVSLSDKDILRMLDIKRDGLPPEEIIKQYISDFRMSL